MSRKNMRLRLRGVSLITGVVALALVGSACSSDSSDTNGSSSSSESSAAEQPSGEPAESSNSGSSEPAPSGDPVTLTFVAYGGETQDYQAEATQVPFTASTGIKFQNDSPPAYPKLKAMVEAGQVTWDVVAMTSAGAAQYCGEFLEEIDDSVVDKSVLDEKVHSSACGVPAYFAQNIEAYNTDTYADNPPTTIEDFFDTAKFPGKRMFPPELEPGILEVALLADGVSVDDLYPLDIERALAKLQTIKADSIYAESYGEMQQAMMDGSVDMVLSPETRLSYVLRDGGPWKAVWDKTVVNWDEWAIPKGTAHSKEANEFLAWVIQPEPQARMAELTTHPEVNPQAKPNYDEFQRAASSFFTEDGDRGTQVFTDPEWWGEHLDEAYEKFTAWQIG